MTAIGDRLPALSGYVRPSTTQEKLRSLLAGLVALCLIWGGVAAWVVTQRASAAANVVSTSEPLSLDGQRIYRSLSDADATAADAFLQGGLEPIATRHHYLDDIANATSHLELATAAAGQSPIARDLAVLSNGIPVYTGEIDTARADNRLGFVIGAAYQREASALMRDKLLPAARDVSVQANAQLTAANGRATGLPLAVVLLVLTVIAGYVLYRAQRWLLRRTRRVFNLGLVTASVAGVVLLLWLAIAVTAARADLLQARDHGSTPVTTLAQADIAALQARADESLTLINGGGDDNFQADYLTVQGRLGPGPGTLLTNAVTAARGSPGAGAAVSAVATATAWYAAHRTVRSLDNNDNHILAVLLVTTPGAGDSETLFGQLDDSLSAAIAADQLVFESKAAAGRDAFTGLEVGVIVLALILAAGCAWGLNRRLAEYR